MIIVAQRKQIINYDNVISIYNVGNVIEIQDVVREIRQIGKYATEERAKEVLQEIVRHYIGWWEEADGEFYQPKVYEMPKE